MLALKIREKLDSFMFVLLETLMLNFTVKVRNQEMGSFIFSKNNMFESLYDLKQVLEWL